MSQIQSVHAPLVKFQVTLTYMYVHTCNNATCVCFTTKYQDITACGVDMRHDQDSTSPRYTCTYVHSTNKHQDSTVV